jgi:apolipoprotein N-acyltransferase
LQALVVAPFAWIAVEFLRTWLFTGFPWELLGYSQHQYLWMIQVADLFGVYGLSGLIVLVNMALALAILSWVEQPWQFEAVSTALVLRTGAVASALIAAVALYGLLAVHSNDQRTQTATKARLAVIQGNIDQSRKWDPSFQLETIAKYKNLSLAVAEKKVDLIIWPETATPFYLVQDTLLTQMVIEGVKAAKTDFVIGSPAVDELQTGGQTYFNSAYLISGDGRVAGKYDKVHLVPFGEYVPLKRFLWFVDKLVAQVGDFKTGTKGRVLENAGYRLGLQICYEIIFSDLSRAMVRNGANLLVNITNDAWFGRTSAAYQHFSMAVFRAVENRRFLARAANTGISGFIDPCGRVLGATPLFTEASLTADVALLDHRTLYSRWGDMPLAVLSFGVVLVTAIGRRTGRPAYPSGAKSISG